jgi:hypothetical protein
LAGEIAVVKLRKSDEENVPQKLFTSGFMRPASKANTSRCGKK